MENNQYRPMSLADWIITYILTAIPVIGIILVFVWAFSGTTQPSKKTWAQATLIIMIVSIFLWFMLFASMMASFI